MKTSNIIFFSLVLFFSVGLQAQSNYGASRLRGNHMDCDNISEYYIWHDASEDLSAVPSSWSVTGGRIIDYYDDFSRITVEWYSPNTHPVRKVQLHSYVLNGRRVLALATINIQTCNTTQGTTYSDATFSSISGGSNLINNQTFTLSGTFTIDQFQAGFINCNIYLEENTQIVLTSQNSYTNFLNCVMFMGKNSSVSINSRSGSNFYIDKCNIEKNSTHNWNGIVANTNDMKFEIRDNFISGSQCAMKINGFLHATIERNVLGKNNEVIVSTNISDGYLYSLSNWFVPSNNVTSVRLVSNLNLNAYINNNIFDKQGINITDVPYSEIRNNKFWGRGAAIPMWIEDSFLSASHGNSIISDNEISEPLYSGIVIANYNSTIYNNIIRKDEPQVYEAGIAIHLVRNNTVNIYSNNISSIIGAAGIWVFGSYPVESCENENISIYNNNINIGYTQLNDNLLCYGVAMAGLSPTSTTRINNNTISLDVDLPTQGAPGECIYLANCCGNNTIEYNTTEILSSNMYGTYNIHILKSPAVIRGNLMKYGYYGLYIDGDCYNSTIKCNKFWANYYGIRLNNARLKSQGSAVAGNASGNVWFGQFGNASNNRKLSGTIQQPLYWYWCENSGLCAANLYDDLPTPISYQPYYPLNNLIACTSNGSGSSFCITPMVAPASNVSNCCGRNSVVPDDEDISYISTEDFIDADYDAYLSSPEEISCKLNLFPNPANDRLTIENVDKELLINIFDMKGQNLSETILNAGTNDISVATLDAGIYMYKISDNQGNILKTGKLTIIR
ncbi:MAG: T9SS type A sorting domain-containing protein [Bacteroidales bacterium]|jgi:hypothetical protein|nr:T9SS type A sorting domain-containing protein [Bacteroidales bacterium]